MLRMLRMLRLLRARRADPRQLRRAESRRSVALRLLLLLRLLLRLALRLVVVVVALQQLLLLLQQVFCEGGVPVSLGCELRSRRHRLGQVGLGIGLGVRGS